MKQAPRRRDFRARAHANPLSDGHFDVPENPDQMPWCEFFHPAALTAVGKAHNHANVQQTDYEENAWWSRLPARHIVDAGCGFGGMTIRLADLFPTHLVVGMELRDKVAAYVAERIAALRAGVGVQVGLSPSSDAASAPPCPVAGNAACLRANAMKHLPHYYNRGAVAALLFLFPDPHFKAANRRRRVIQASLLDEYAFVLCPGGRVYFATDVEELGEWMAGRFNAHPLFCRVAASTTDPIPPLLINISEEAKKVARNAGRLFVGIFERI